MCPYTADEATAAGQCDSRQIALLSNHQCPESSLIHIQVNPLWVNSPKVTAPYQTGQVSCGLSSMIPETFCPGAPVL